MLGMLLSGLLVGAADGASLRASPALADSDPLACSTWAEQVVGPTGRALRPVGARWLDGEELGDDDFDKLLVADQASFRLSQPGRALVLDFGDVVSGKIEVDVLGASGATVAFSTSESLAFLGVGGDTQAYGNGDLVHRPAGGPESWHAPVRRTFRYLLLSLREPGWVDLDRVGVYFTAALAPPSAFGGRFVSSDPLLNSIWYRSAYTLELASAPGTSTGLDGTLEVWRGQLDMAALFGGRLLLARPGNDWRDYTFDFDVTIAPGGRGAGWVVRGTPQSFTAYRLAVAEGDQPTSLQTWRGTNGGPAALETALPLTVDVRSGRSYHVRVDAAGDQVVMSIDGRLVTSGHRSGHAQGSVGFWAASGDQFSVAHPRVFGSDGTLLFEDQFEGQYLDPEHWDGAPQPLLLDGAKRDRALGVADLTIAARAEYLSFGNWQRMRALLGRVGAHQYADGRMPGGLVGNDTVAPEGPDLPDYTFWWVLGVGDYVRQTGDVQALQDLFPHVQHALAWGEAMPRTNGLLPKGPGVDWYWTANRGAGPTTTLNVLYVASLTAAAEMADVLGLADVRARYAREAADLRAAINEQLWDAAAGAYVDGDLRDHHPLDANALAVLYGVASPQQADLALSYVRANLWTPAGTLTADRPYGAWAHDAAIWPAYVYPEVEARFSQDDDDGALEVLRRTWGNMLAHDPGSTFWEFATQDGGIRDGSTSLAHAWSTGALPALSTWVLGLRPLRPGYTEYSMAPHPGDLSWACGAVPTPAGAIRAAWHQTDDRFTIELDAPSGTRGEVVIPWTSAATVLLDDQPVAPRSSAEGRLVLENLAPGQHVVDARRGDDEPTSPQQGG